MRRTVNRETHVLHLARNAVFALEDVQGLEVRVEQGAAWLTQEGDARDIVVGTGEGFRFARAGRVVVQALRGATVLSFARRRESNFLAAISRLRTRLATHPSF